ncbi:MAG: LysM peptidoglycan-binding domain-containing protein [Ignavibacteriales bacterium]|nr:LysM peptidoglycan-binding domain-containing protein [Ignavibacteriales bacterium]
MGQVHRRQEEKDSLSAPVAGKSKERAQEIDAASFENDGEFIEYRPKKGDTLDKIASKFNIDKEDLLESNSITGKKLPKSSSFRKSLKLDDSVELVELSNKPSQALAKQR